MNIDKLFSTLVGSYHDGALCDAVYENGTLHMQCFRNPADPDHTEDPDNRYVIIRFDNVTELQFYDWGCKEFVPYEDGMFCREDGYDAITGIDYLDYEDDFVVFGQCMRFHAEDIELLAHSSEEFDFSKYVSLKRQK